MREKAINGKLYSVDTAEPVAAFCECFPEDGPRQYEEILYVKRNGEFFIYGRGGAESKYGYEAGGERIAGSEILPVTVAVAKCWTEEHFPPHIYEDIWGPVEE